VKKMIKAKNKLKLITVILISIFVISSINSTAKILLEIELGDSWTYKVTTDTIGTIYSTTTETVVFNVTDIDYLPAIDEQSEEMKVNRIKSNKTVDNFKVYNFNVEIDIKEISIWKGSARLSILFSNPSDDYIYKSSRGNILYNRLTNFTLNITLTDIIYNNTKYNDYTFQIDNLRMIEECSNPSIVETISTGTVQINKRSFTLYHENSLDDYFIDGIINETEIMDLEQIKFVIEERYEASNDYLFEDKNCRNITITPLKAYVEDIFICGHDNYWVIEYGDVNIPIIQETWIYTYDIGLPLVIEENLLSSTVNKILSTNKETNVDTGYNKIMKLIDFDIQNSTYEFPTEETPLLLTFGLLGIGIISIVIKKRKTKQKSN